MSISIHYLVDTSVEDMKSSLDCDEANGEHYPIDFLKQALVVVTKRGEKTKAKMLEVRIRKYERLMKKKMEA